MFSIKIRFRFELKVDTNSNDNHTILRFKYTLLYIIIHFMFCNFKPLSYNSCQTNNFQYQI